MNNPFSSTLIPPPRKVSIRRAEEQALRTRLQSPCRFLSSRPRKQMQLPSNCLDWYISLSCLLIMDTAKLYKNGRSQALRLPKKYQFPGEKERIGGKRKAHRPYWHFNCRPSPGSWRDYGDKQPQGTLQSAHNLDLSVIRSSLDRLS